MFREIVTLEGHIIDSRALANVLADVVRYGGEFRILEFEVGRTPTEPSRARLEVRADTHEQMEELLARISQHGAVWHEAEDVQLVEADCDGAFPESFYSTTNQRTFVRYRGAWHEVERQEMDCGIRYDPERDRFECIPMIRVRRGDRIVCGHGGIRVQPNEPQSAEGLFRFMASEVSSEKPKTTIIRNCARQMLEARKRGRKLLLVAGPAIVHTGATPHVVRLIERGYIHRLFAGNALAVHDIEHALFGTSLGVYIERATLAEAGHEHHLRAINAIRRAGSIRAAVEQGLLTRGLMHACVRHDVPFVLAGSIRDDGPLPEVITDTLAAQDAMREAIRDVGFVLMVATALHSIAVGNLLPAWVPVVCVDISPAVLTKLADRGSFQRVGLVTDVEPFFRELIDVLEVLEAGGG